MTSRASRSPRAILLAALLAASSSFAGALDPPAEPPPVKPINIPPTITVVDPSTFEQVQVKRGPPISVVGHLSRAGVPIPDVEVVAWKVLGGFHNVCDDPPSMRGARLTAEDGSFELVVPGAGLYCLQPEATGHNYPASLVNVPNVATHTLDIELPSACLSGSVIDKSTRGPVARARVVARELWPRRRSGASATTSRDGHFHMDLEASEYSVTASLDKGGGVAHEEVSVGERGLAGVVLSLAPALQIIGRVVDEEGRGVAGVEVREAPPSPLHYNWAHTGPNGQFRIDGLAEREYVLGAQSDSRFATRRGIQPGGDEVLLTLRDPGYASVVVRDPQGQTTEGILVLISRIDGAPASVWVHGETDDEGQVEIALPEGMVELFVMAEVDPGRVEVIGETTVSVREGEMASTVLSLRKPPLARPQQP